MQEKDHTSGQLYRTTLNLPRAPLGSRVYIDEDDPVMQAYKAKGVLVAIDEHGEDMPETPQEAPEAYESPDPVETLDEQPADDLEAPPAE